MNEPTPKTWNSSQTADVPPPNPDELTAARLALDGNAGQRLWVGLRAFGRLLNNPNDVRQVFVLGVAINARHFPDFMARFVAAPGGRELLRDKPAIDSRAIDFTALAALPPDTLGGAFARHLKDNNLDPDLFQAPPGLPEPVAYVVQRIRQTHDLWHVLTGYATDIPGELALQAFYYGLIGLPSSLLISLFGTLRYTRRFRRTNLLRAVHKGYQRGRQAAFLPTVRWEEMWQQPLTEVRRRVGIEPLAA